MPLKNNDKHCSFRVLRFKDDRIRNRYTTHGSEKSKGKENPKGWSSPMMPR